MKHVDRMKHRKMKQQTESESETEEVTEIETVEETSSEEPAIDLSTATKEDILYYIEAIVEMRVMHSMLSSAVLESMTISLYGWHSMEHKRISC